MTIAITTPTAYHTFQRSSAGAGTIAIAGTYSGSPTAIEASFDGGAYATIDTAPDGGVYAGSLPAAVGRGTLTVRFANDTGDNATVANVAIGEVFGWLGQSNASGRLDNGQPFTGAIAAAVYDRDGAWIALASNYQTPGVASFYSVLPLVASLLTDYLDVPVGFVNESQSSTGLVAPDADWSPGGTNYEYFVTSYTAAAPGGLTALLYYQGERDVVNDISQADYATAVSAMVDGWQTALDLTCPCLVALIAMYTSQPDAAVNTIRAAQLERWENDSDILPGPTGHDQQFTDGVHWASDTEAATLAERWLRTIAGGLYGDESARGPVAESATYHGDIVTVRFAVVGALQGVTDTTGWQISDASGARSISSAAGRGDSGVALTVTGGALVAPVTVSYAQGAEVGGTLTDSELYPLPAEPVLDLYVEKGVVVAALSGQITVSTAGTAVQGSVSPAGYDVAIKAHPDNAGVIWVGNDGAADVTSANGFPLAAGEGVVVPDLRQYWFDAGTNGDIVCWVAVAR